MLQYGRNITAYADPLKSISIDELVNRIEKPDEQLKSLIFQLRAILTIDIAKYRQLKTMLPYFVCGIFNPPWRKTENFGSIQYLILDFDHLHQKNYTSGGLQKKLIDDDRVMISYTTPSNDGLKVMFKLNEPCYDHVKYSVFYKIFADSFSKQYHINQIIDSRTSDVTRACFLSYDPYIYYNAKARTLQMNDWIDFEDYAQVTLAHQLIKKQKEELKDTEQFDASEKNQKPLTPDILQQIRSKLNPNIRVKIPKQIVPSVTVENKTPEIIKKLNEYDINVKEIATIHYGKKFVVEIPGNRWAEINVFYGKNGFSVVKTPKRGSNEELCDIAHKIICQMLL